MWAPVPCHQRVTRGRCRGPAGSCKPQGSAESEARAGWWELLLKCLCSKKFGALSRSHVPAHACVGAARPGGTTRCPGRFWPRWRQPSLPKPDGTLGQPRRFRASGQSAAVPPARQPLELAVGAARGLSGNTGIAGIRRWGIGEPAGAELPETRSEAGGAMRQIRGNQRQRLGRVRGQGRVCEHACAGVRRGCR